MMPRRRYRGANVQSGFGTPHAASSCSASAQLCPKCHFRRSCPVGVDISRWAMSSNQRHFRAEAMTVNPSTGIVQLLNVCPARQVPGKSCGLEFELPWLETASSCAGVAEEGASHPREVFTGAREFGNMNRITFETVNRSSRSRLACTRRFQILCLAARCGNRLDREAAIVNSPNRPVRAQQGSGSRLLISNLITKQRA